jgi:CubicO group peptidase (beta-lactamase class C family)
MVEDIAIRSVFGRDSGIAGVTAAVAVATTLGLATPIHAQDAMEARIEALVPDLEVYIDSGMKAFDNPGSPSASSPATSSSMQRTSACGAKAGNRSTPRPSPGSARTWGYRWTLDGTVEVPFTPIFPYGFGAAGAINSTIEDLSHWVRFQLADGDFDRLGGKPRGDPGGARCGQ